MTSPVLHFITRSLSALFPPLPLLTTVAQEELRRRSFTVEVWSSFEAGGVVRHGHSETLWNLWASIKYELGLWTFMVDMVHDPMVHELELN